jgi:hypothetical protein
MVMRRWLLALLDGRLLRLLGRFARAGGLLARAPRLLGGLAEISGAGALARLSGFLTLVDAGLSRMIARLRRARRWLAHPTTSIVLVSAVHGEAPEVAASIARALHGLAPPLRLVLVNRALPASLCETPPPAGERAPPPARAFARYVAGYARLQARIAGELSQRFPRVALLPEAGGLDGETGVRLDALARLGAQLADQGLT